MRYPISTRIRRLAVIAVLAAVQTLWSPALFAQTPAASQPSASGKPPPPLPASSATAGAPPPPPLPPDVGDSDADAAPQVTVIHRDQQVVEEVRVHGQLRYIRVTPPHGRPYYLIPDAAGGTFARRDSLDSTLMVPLWVLFTF